MSLTLKIQDDSTTKVYTLLEVPFTKNREIGESTVSTLGGNVYTDYIYKKFKLEHTWSFMSAADYAVLEGFFNRQFTTHKYPRITVQELGIEDVPCRMTLNEQKIVNNCGMVEDITVTFRETAQS